MRELAAAVERAAILGDGKRLEIERALCARGDLDCDGPPQGSSSVPTGGESKDRHGEIATLD